jgi:hypothetical protein
MKKEQPIGLRVEDWCPTERRGYAYFSTPYLQRIGHGRASYVASFQVSPKGEVILTPDLNNMPPSLDARLFELELRRVVAGLISPEKQEN